jgi:uncharacterized delta-60 repeat protein
VDEAHAVAIQADGKIVRAGESEDRFLIARYDADGTIDGTFGDSGEVSPYLGWGTEGIAYAVAIQADGKIVAAGVSGNKFALARYNADGAADTTFGGDGSVTTHLGSKSFDLAFAVAVQPDGKLVAAGVSNDRFALVRYRANGKLDTTFSGDGR